MSEPEPAWMVWMVRVGLGLLVIAWVIAMFFVE